LEPSASDVDLVDIEIIETHGHTSLVQYEEGGLLYRSFVDTLDIVGEQCPRERLNDAPYGIDWERFLKIPDLKRIIHDEMTRHNIWTKADLQQQDRIIIRIATDTLGRAIWRAVKKSCKE
jgi:hypothetical protein